MRGVGQILSMLFLSQAVVQSVPPRDAGDASGLFNAMRNLGGSFALAGISVLQQDRVWFHSRRIEETLNANQPAVQDYVGGLGRAVGNADAGIRVLGQTIQGQALVMTYNDIFFVMSLVTVMVMPLILFLRPLPRSAAVAGLH
jgi:DHA2 family multidrug resistance protein